MIVADRNEREGKGPMVRIVRAEAKEKEKAGEMRGEAAVLAFVWCNERRV